MIVDVPKRFEVFHTTHFNCYTMEKLDFTLSGYLLKDTSKGVDMSLVCKILKSCVPIIRLLHHKFNYLYVDFATSNIGLHNKEGELQAYMIDFGSLHMKGFTFPPSTFTTKYSSINALKHTSVTYKDDFESLGYVLLEAYYGNEHSPNRLNPTTEVKEEVYQNALNSTYGEFFHDYFTIVENGDFTNTQTYDSLINLADRFKTQKNDDDRNTSSSSSTTTTTKQ
eukprot:TRINITY_DN5560_c2_g1_i1.p1 TRINITY_DN5560_c2_g1~~TRINITY_DN5560_c2_g1_i1.p1  ORF type:complete len:224 (-),score=53.22 TRINITY_DN5560_c2_g1_i1:80-751(-)